MLLIFTSLKYPQLLIQLFGLFKRQRVKRLPRKTGVKALEWLRFEEYERNTRCPLIKYSVME